MADPECSPNLAKCGDDKENFPFLCTNCSCSFKTPETFICHTSNKMAACAFRENERVSNLETFTPENIYKGLIQKRYKSPESC